MAENLNLNSVRYFDRQWRLADWFRLCNFCGSLWGRRDYLCETCWQDHFHLDRMSAPIRSWREGAIVRSLFSWKDSRRFNLSLMDVDSKDIAILLKAFKGGRLLSANDRLAVRFWNSILSFEEIPRLFRMPTVLVPAPPSGEGWDHGSAWASSLSRITGFPILPILERGLLDPEIQTFLKRIKGSKPVIAHQKERNKLERRMITLKVKGELLNPIHEVRFIFVDDVVTTGATMGAAYQALGQPSHFECWSIACRG